jgi:prevent-host-death family protein
MSVERSVTVSQARAALPDIVQRVADGEEVTITRHGKAVAVVVRPDSLRVRRAGAALEGAALIRDLLAAGKDTPLEAAPSLGEERAEEMIRDLRAGRRWR